MENKTIHPTTAAEILRLTKDLIRFKTMHSAPDEIHRCADFISDYLKGHHIHHQTFEHNGYPSILILPRPDDAPILLMSHIDVVDAPESLFDPAEKDGSLYGRGAIDDKYAAALSLVLLKEHIQRLEKAGKGVDALPFGILITSDEEVGGHDGAEKVLADVKVDFCIALDGGTLNKVVSREKGLLTLKLIANGKSAHGARPWLGENAIENLIADFNTIKAEFNQTGPGHWHRTLNFSKIQAGQSFNQVPDRAEAIFDIRYTEDDDPETLFRLLQEKTSGELVIEEKEPMFLGGESPYLDLLVDMYGDIVVGNEHGASDARFLSVRGIRGIVWGPEGDNSAHTLTEHVRLDSLFALYDRLDAFMEKAGK
ncbi:MAG: M20 family peptidase [Deltaproteobacteria bacterium]|nr:MAG: M20 family peptidase [Deltaproteobacteria bacterium]